MFGSRRRDADAALRRFGRQERGYLDQVRLESLDRELLRLGPRSVRSTVWTMGGNRGRIELDDGTRLRLWLYWQGDGSIASIARVYHQDEVGWVVIARRPSGDVVRWFAFRIMVDAPATGRDRTRSRP